MSETFFYSVIHPVCSCRQKNGELRNIGKYYKQYYQRISKGERSVDVLNSMIDDDGIGFNRMCCRSRFMSIPIVPMIDRSKERIYDDRRPEVVTQDTAKIEPGYEPPEFPPLDSRKTLRVVPPTVNVSGALPKGF